MRKRISYFVTSLLLSLLFIILCGCNSSTTLPKYVVTFNADNGSELITFTLEEGQSQTMISSPTKEDYEFVCWVDDNNKEYQSSDTLIVNSNITLKAKWVDHLYEYIFKDEDGTILKQEKAVKGSSINYPNNPTKEATAELEYIFNGWDYKDTTLTKDIVFTASYQSQIRKYVISFEDEDGTILESYEVAYGTIPSEPVTPTKEADKTNTYTFNGWDKELVAVTKEETYVATYTATPIAKPKSLDNLTLSILGDSISTFYSSSSTINSYYHEDGRFYYPLYCKEVGSVDKTWWHQLYTATNMKLGINNSWSGSTAYGTSSSCGMTDDRINTLGENGNPDIVIVYLGTNDSASIYETTYTFDNYRLALETIINKIKTKYGSDIFFIELCGKSTFKEGNYIKRAYQFNEIIEDVASKNGCGVIPIQEYVNKDNDYLYLNDNLHFNLKGTTLLAKVCEKYIKDYYGIEFKEEIKVEYPEKLPEGVLAYATATARSGFWKNNAYVTNTYLSTPSDEASLPLFSDKIAIKKNTDNIYVVTEIVKSGASLTGTYDFVYYVSSSNTSYSTISGNLTSVKVGSIVEFDDQLSTFPLTITFKEGTSTPPETPPTQPDEPTENTPMYKDGVLHIGKYNGGIWTDYDKAIIAYSDAGLTDKSSLYSNFYVIKLTKNTDNANYKVVGLKASGNALTFESCDYYIFIYNTLEAKAFYESLALNDVVTITGDITAGNANITKAN